MTDSSDSGPRSSFIIPVNFFQIDWAGRVFHSRIFEIAQVVMEKFMATTELWGIAKLIKEGEPLPVVVHAESDYLAQIILGDDLLVEISCVKIGKTSFTLQYDMFKLVVGGRMGDRADKKDMVLAAKVKIVHVLVKDNKKLDISHPWKPMLEKIYRHGDE